MTIEQTKFIFVIKYGSLWEERKIENWILWLKLCYIGQIYTTPKYIWKKIEKRIYNFQQKIRPPRQLPIKKGGLDVLDIVN